MDKPVRYRYQGCKDRRTRRVLRERVYTLRKRLCECCPEIYPLQQRAQAAHRDGVCGGAGTVYADTDADLGNNHMRKSLDVAKQMAHGNGKYIKGKGWQ